MLTSGLDHLVIVSSTLDDGVRWCNDHLGVSPGPGGAHPLMGTHNRLLSLASPAFPHAYLEIIALDPAATPTRAPGLRRWFDMDDPGLMSTVRTEGPVLAHWVARTSHVQDVAALMRAHGYELGEVLQASRMTPYGLLEWQITVRDDGQRLLGGTLPTLIEWGAMHPTDHMEPSGVMLERLVLRYPQPQALEAALQAAGLLLNPGIQIEAGEPGLQAVLIAQGTPRTIPAPQATVLPI
jgi:hypothetical protein